MCSSEFNLQGTIMNYLPSKELLTAIRNDKYIVIDIDTSDIADSKIGYLLDNNQWYFINIYELAHKCILYAWDNFYEITPRVMGAEIMCLKTGYTVHTIYREEIEKPEKFDARYTYKACQWILDNRN